jgi:hypothetical protein
LTSRLPGCCHEAKSRVNLQPLDQHDSARLAGGTHPGFAGRRRDLDEAHLRVRAKDRKRRKGVQQAAHVSYPVSKPNLADPAYAFLFRRESFLSR